MIIKNNPPLSLNVFCAGHCAWQLLRTLNRFFFIPEIIQLILMEKKMYLYSKYIFSWNVVEFQENMWRYGDFTEDDAKEFGYSR